MTVASYARRRPRDSNGEGGFALPVALLVLVLLSMMSSTGLYVARSDFRAAEATRQAAVAMAAADAGASLTVAQWGQLVPSLPQPGDSLVLGWQSLPDGSQYRSVVMRAPVGEGEPASFRVLMRTTGRVRTPAEARRTVVTVVDVTGGPPLCCTTALKVNAKLEVEGPKRDDGLIEVDGRDRTPPGWSAQCTAPPIDLPGVESSDTTEVELKDTGTIDGVPPKALNSDLDPLDFTNYGSTTYDELIALANASFTKNTTLKNAIGPVVVGGNCVTSNRNNWGSPWSPSGPCGDYFPVIHVAGDLKIQGAGQGQGILLVDEDLEIEDNFEFYGLIIVLGVLKLEGPTNVFGALMVRNDEDGEGRSEVKDLARVLYSGCAVQRALASLPSSVAAGAGFSAEEFAWFESIE